MQSRLFLLNICARRKCTGVSADGKVQFTRRKVRLRKSEETKTLTSVNGRSEGTESGNNGQTFAVASSLVDSGVASKAKGSSFWNEYNTPVIPENFETGFFGLFGNSKNVKTKSEKVEETVVGTEEKVERGGTVENNTRVNEINMQMLSKPLYDQLFRNIERKEQISQEEIETIKQNFSIYGINTEDATRLPDVDIRIPPLEGNDIEEHFYNIGKAQLAPYQKIIDELIQDIPEMPKVWLLREGWTRYTKDGAESVDYPLEDGLVFDVEVCMKEGPLPTLATAVSKKAWYGWVSKSLVEGTASTFEGQAFNMNMLIPIESTANDHGQKLNQHQKKPKIIVGHNVSYDRTRIKEQYWLHSTGTRFVDTMSMHVSVSGINSYQRSILKTEKADGKEQEWLSRTSLNSLAEIYKLYCDSDLSKEPRNIFTGGTIKEVREQFSELMTYCAMDVIATHSVLSKLFPIFQERFPHPVTLTGMLELGCAYLPVNSNWQRYLEEAESTFEDLNYEAKFTLAKRADATLKLMHEEKYKEDLWMWDQDWSTQDIKLKSSLPKSKLEAVKQETEVKKEESDYQKYLTDGEDEEDPLQTKFAYLEDTKYLLPKKKQHMPGYPAWYRKLCPKEGTEDWAPGPQNISTSMQVVPKLLNLTWENYPLHYINKCGWGILVPYSDDPDVKTDLPIKQLINQCPLRRKHTSDKDEIDYSIQALQSDVEKNLHKTEFWRFKKKKNPDHTALYKGTAVWCDVDIDNCCYFFKLPHKDGAKFNVGNPLAKDFLNKFSENVLVGLDASATHILKIARMVSYWRNNRNRILSQFVVWFEDHCLPSSMKKTKKHMRYGAILPQVVVSGTLTRRAVEPTWMTASNAHEERVGSELRSMIQAPPGYNIVGADVDSQELWIASLIGDAHYKKIHGATPFGWMTLIGNKSNGTDMHSVTAKAVGISRDHAKIINYARIYGAGQKFAERLLKQFNPSMTESEASSKARKMFALTKGKKVFRLRPEYLNDDLSNKMYSPYEAYHLAKILGKTLHEVFEKSEWIGGSESAMFNRLEEIAGSANPVTPFLDSRLSRALENNVNDEKYLPTKINWVVQSGAVDFLHLMLVSMRWLMRDHARFCLSFHDEVRYLVPSRYKYNAALAMHVTNLLTRSFCASRLGMKDLPMSVAFFGAVEVDTVLRKESSHDCKTPSNPHGLQNGYEIPLGESLDIWKALEKSEGSLGWWHEGKSRKTKVEELPQESDTS